jgi:hypothetical protein
MSVVNTKPINSITKLYSVFNYSVEGIPLSGVVDDELQVIKVTLFCGIEGLYSCKSLSSLGSPVDKDDDVIELPNWATLPPQVELF